MVDEIDTRVSLDLDEQNITAMEIYDEDTRPVLEGTIGLLRNATQTLRAVHDAKAAAATDPTLNEAAQLVKVDDFATARMMPVMKQWDYISGVLGNNIKQFESELNTPIVAKASQMVSGEIRSYFKGLQPDARLNAMKAAIDTGDEVSVSAVLGAPSYLSGMTDELAETYRREWAAKANPIVAKRLAAVTAAKEYVDRRGSLLHTERAKAVGHIEVRTRTRGGPDHVQIITAAQIRAKRDKANTAFAAPGN